MVIKSVRQTALEMEAYGNEEGYGITMTWKRRNGNERYSLAQAEDECGRVEAVQGIQIRGTSPLVT